MKNKILFVLLPLLLCCTQAKQPAAATLAAPTDVVTQVLSATEALLSWKDNAEGEDGYYVFGAGVQPVATVPAGNTAYVFSGLEPETAYTFGVQAYGKDGALSLKVMAPPVTTPALEPEPEPEPEPALTFQWQSIAVEGLPAAVKVYKTGDPLDGRPFQAWYAIADPKEVAVRVLYPGGGKKATIDAQAEAEGNCLVLINGGIFGTAPIGFALLDGVQTPWRYVEDDNWAVDKQYWGPDGKLHTVSRGLFGVDQGGVPGVYWSFTPSHGTVRVYDQPIPSVAGGPVQKEADDSFPCAPADWEPYNALTCGPVLLQNGQCPITDEKSKAGYWLTNYEMWADDIYGVDNRADRTAVGYTAEGKVILFICDGRIASSQGATTLEMASILKGLGCVGALNLDGGGSTGMWVRGAGHLNDLTGGNRAVMTTIGFFAK